MSGQEIEAVESPQPLAESRLAAGFRWIDARLEALSDYVNPILVKETRQALKSQQFVLWYLLLLVGCWVVTMGGLAIIGPAAYYGAFGGKLFLWYAWILSFPLLVVAPFSAFRSLAAEQEENTRDVLTVSALTPSQVINGKLGSAALQVLIYLSAMAPCLAFAFLLRGLDAMTLLLPLMGVLASLGLALVGLLLASLSRLRHLQILLNVAFITTLLVLFYNAYGFLEEFIDNGFRWYQNAEFWISMAALLTAYLTTFLLAYFVAVACNTFTTANRSTPIRVAMLIQQAAFVGWVAAVWLENRDSGTAFFGFVCGLAYWTAAGMFFTSEEPILSPRVRRTLPVTSMGRQLFTLLMPGPGTGYFFVLANIGYLMALCYASVLLFPSRAPLPGQVMWAPLIMACYAAAYLGMGRLLILLLRRVAELSLFGGFLIHVLLMLVGGAMPFAFEAATDMGRREAFSYLDVTSPAAIVMRLERDQITPTEAVTTGLLVVGAAACVGLINLVLAAAEVRQTRLPVPQRILEEESAKRAGPPQSTNPWGDAQRPALEPP